MDVNNVDNTEKNTIRGVASAGRNPGILLEVFALVITANISIYTLFSGLRDILGMRWCCSQKTTSNKTALTWISLKDFYIGISRRMLYLLVQCLLSHWRSLVLFCYFTGMWWQEIKQIYEEGYKMYLASTWNWLDITMLNLYVSCFILKIIGYGEANKAIRYFIDNEDSCTKFLNGDAEANDMAYYVWGGIGLHSVYFQNKGSLHFYFVLFVCLFICLFVYLFCFIFCSQRWRDIFIFFSFLFFFFFIS